MIGKITISEFIKKLEEIKSQVGDVPVVAGSDYICKAEPQLERTQAGSYRVHIYGGA